MHPSRWLLGKAGVAAAERVVCGEADRLLGGGCWRWGWRGAKAHGWLTPYSTEAGDWLAGGQLAMPVHSMYKYSSIYLYCTSKYILYYAVHSGIVHIVRTSRDWGGIAVAMVWRADVAIY